MGGKALKWLSRLDYPLAKTGETVNGGAESAVHPVSYTHLDVYKRQIVLLPLDEDGENEDGEVWFYGYSENPDDPNEEPIRAYIEDDDVYEKVADAFDEYLDSCEFDEIIDDNDSEE